MWTIAEFDTVDDELLRRRLLACCAAPRWADAVARGRPYRERAALLSAADVVFASLDADQLARAVTAHPVIGERPRDDGEESDWSRREQSAALHADDATRAELRQANLDYQRRFGHVFLIRAAGRDTGELLAEARRRLGNDPAAEARETARELRDIVRLRLEGLVSQ